MADSVTKLMQQAIAHHGRGALDDATRLYDRVLQREPEHADALHLTGVVAHQQGRNEEAVRLITRAIAVRPRAPAFRNNLGMALAALGKIEQAEDAYRDALALVPDFADAVLNLGNLRAGQGRFEDAVTLLEKAGALDTLSPQAHFNLGCARFALGDSEGALSALQRAAARGADSADLDYRIGSVHLSLGAPAEAGACFRRVLARESDHPGAQHGLLECLDLFTEEADAGQLEAVVGALLRAKSVNPRAFGHAAARLLERKYRLDADGKSGEAPERLCYRLLDDETVRLYLQRTVNVSAPLERLLTRCRARWLASTAERRAIAALPWAGVAAVAIQCVLNEFVWAVTPDEERAADVLERRINRAWTSAAPADKEMLSDMLVYGCYRPLWRIECAERLKSAPAETWPPELREVVRVGVHEPLRERELLAEIATGHEVRDIVSRAVRAQYEESPYPRWLAITRSGARDVEQWVKRWCPAYVAPTALRGPLRMLVAGCGTGMDAIDAALHLNNVRVTAVDLSRASLAYAMRKAEELGIGNIQFRQEDILGIDRDDGPYHVINCTGVLHHMDNPAGGLERLVDLLIPDGLIKLALYSRVAREPLSKARDMIRASGFGPDVRGIRSFRRRVLEEGEGGALAELMGSADFYTVSECRDLLFHVHEVQFDLPGLRRLLEETGLEFLGLELTIARVEAGFRSENPDAVLTDLDAWADYEQRHPESFRSMYHFWCRKAGT